MRMQRRGGRVLPVRPWADRARLAVFFSRLAIKEHLRPALHVKPLAAELFLTDNCNLKCVSCACWRTVTRKELDGAEWRDVIDQLAALGIVKANFTGGEPLLRRDAPELMAYAYSRGIRNLHVNTNAVLLDERRRYCGARRGRPQLQHLGRRPGRRDPRASARRRRLVRQDHRPT